MHARRAAGWAIGVQARRTGDAPETQNALRLLAWYARDTAAVAEPLRAAAGRLVVHITPDHVLPHEQDPLKDADDIIRACLPDLEFGAGDDAYG